jgi:hypothetical protein
MLAVPVWPSLEVAVTVYVTDPSFEASSWPGLVDPLLSLHEEIPGPLAPSVHEKLVDTLSPTVYLPPEFGEMIEAVGFPATA